MSNRLSAIRAEVVAGCRENGIGVVVATFEMAAAKVSVCLRVADHGFDGGSASELAADNADDACVLR